MTKLHRLFPPCLLLAAFLVACGSPPEPEEVAQRSSSIISSIVSETAKSLQSLKDLQELQSLLNGLDMAAFWSEDEVQAAPPPASSPEEASSGWDLDPGEVDTQEIARVLEQHIFHPDNVEGTDGDSIIFLLDGQRLCRELGTRAETCAMEPGDTVPQCAEAPDPDCADVIDQLQIRIAARLLGDQGVQLRISLGGNGTLITITLQPARAEVRLSLDNAKKTVAHVAQVVEEPLPGLPEILSGSVSAALAINGPQDVTIQVAAPTSVRVQGTTEQGSYRVGLEARDPLASLRVRAVPKTALLSVDWGALDLALPAGAVLDEATGQLELLLQGLTASLEVTAGQPLQILGIGLGDLASWLKLDGETLVELDLNAGAGRTFDLEAQPDEGMPLCTVSPLLEVEALLDLSPLQPYIEDPLPDWALGERYSLLLDSAAGSPVVLPVEQTPTFEGGLKVVQGTLTLESQVDPHTVQVSQGSCLTYVDDLGPGEHPPLSHLVSAPCP